MLELHGHQLCMLLMGTTSLLADENVMSLIYNSW
jgi:hypothetical protein